MANKLCLVLVIFLCFLAATPAATTYDLLSIYGFQNTKSVEVAVEELEALEESYYTQKTILYNKEMLRESGHIGATQMVERIAELDLEIGELAEASDLQLEAVTANLTAETQVLVNLNKKYASLRGRLRLHQEQRTELLSQLSELTDSPITTETEKLEVQRLEAKVNAQKEVVDKAKSYSVIGEVSSVKHPVVGDFKITSPYGSRWNPVTQSSYEVHSGLDFKAPMRSTVLSVWAGKVEKVTTTWGGGNTVWINHGDGVKTVYMHLSEPLVKEGQSVKQYEAVALSGNSGALTTGPHLHLGIYINGKSVDPGKINWR